MKKEKLVKSLIVLFIAMALIAISTNVFALTDDELFKEDLTGTLDTGNNSNTDTDATTSTDDSGKLDINTNINPSTNTDTNTNNETNTTTNTETNTNTNTNKYDTNLPDTGLAENTMLVVLLAVLSIVAIVAYRKTKYYKNI